MSVRLIAFTDQGEELAKRIADKFEGTVLRSHGHDQRDSWTKENFMTGNVLIFIGALGICIRTIAPYVCDKTTDPAVIDIDDRAVHVIPVLSGHLGGANAFARELADFLDSDLVLTTATDVNGRFPVDDWARKNGLRVLNTKRIKHVSSSLLSGKTVKASSDVTITGDLPEGIVLSDTDPDIYIGYRKTGDRALTLVPKMCVLGIGCRRGTSYEDLEEGLQWFLEEHGILRESISAVASIDLKKDEEGLKTLCEKNGWDFITYSAEELKAVEGVFSASEFVSSVTGVDNVCERSALRCAGPGGELIVRKQAREGKTYALAVMDMKYDWRCN